MNTDTHHPPGPGTGSHPGTRHDKGRIRARIARGLAAAVLVVLAGCAESTPSTSDEPATTSTTVTTTAPDTTTTVPGLVVDGSGLEWGDPSADVDLGEGWALAACEGDAPLLCVSHDQVTVGIVEALRFPTETLGFFDSSRTEQVNLALLADEYLSSLASDRSNGCGEGYIFEPREVENRTVAGLEGVSYGFAGSNPNGTASELHLQYAVVSGADVVLLVAAAYDEGGCPGRDDTSGFDTASLAEVQDRLAAALESVPLPPA